MWWFIVITISLWGSDGIIEHAIPMSPAIQDIPGYLVKDYVMKQAATRYFNEHPEIWNKIEPKFTEVLSALPEAIGHERYKKFKSRLRNLKDSESSQASEDIEVNLFAEEVLSQVLTRSMSEENEYMKQLTRRASQRVPRRTVAIITAISSIVVAALTAAVSLGAQFSNCN
jgi:hypothetical protein